MLVAALFGHDGVPGDMMRGTIDGAAIVIHDAHATLCQHGDVAVRKEENVPRMLEKGGNVAGYEIFSVTESDHGRRADASCDDLVRITRGEKYQGVNATQLLEGCSNRLLKRHAALGIFFRKMRHNFRIGLGHKFVALALELLLQFQIIFDDSVVNNDDLAGAVAMRMGVFFRGTAVSGPAGVSDPVGALNGRFVNYFLEIAQLTRSSPDFQFSVRCDDGDPRGIVAAVFQFSQPFDNDGHHSLRPDVTDNSAHARRLLNKLAG